MFECVFACVCVCLRVFVFSHKRRYTCVKREIENTILFIETLFLMLERITGAWKASRRGVP